ncbi:bifunctional indole-3-glycerol-phosphate synthase TrpC/phosphoribosylanthranilate isomerase TrpF [Alteromonas flava]|uniref:bifunctional indole-3-glycerol-phosphate synthase TrpC/phosphoribosylanthranilate isomerase TrpF n=1 Tax=Alteromonas flava TaxID=2048003 RepID=UPI000C29244C|nr:bifunctional indole-3-glycerol-phosphate synthase TrpC/phosphoribosylanthranilate isomerase TrpF [Alteromonas flava]
MANVLETIVKDKRAEIDQRIRTFPLEQFVDQLKPTTKSFFAALAAPGSSFILECKKASPSKGLIRENFDLDEILAAYTPYAACISVLTDEKYFHGKFEYLQTVTSQVSQPVINKDFFIDQYQIHLARYYGADAVLLMLSVLDDAQYQTLADLAAHYNMAVLTEVSNAEEMQRAIALKANIIGINNRNLRDLSTDLATTERLTPMLANVDYPHVVISESGIYTQADVQRLAPLCDGFLVGSALMAQTDLRRAVQRLVYPATKICGVTDVETAQLLSALPTQYVGLIFAEKSKRKISFAQAKRIVAAAANAYVGVFVDQPIDFIAHCARELNLAAVQLHGNEPLEQITALKNVLGDDCEIWRAIGIDASLSAPDALPSVLTDGADRLWQVVDKVLLDCKVGANSGGTGQEFDWSLINAMVYPDRLILAGGIGIKNSHKALATGVSLIDINSGVEDAPGQKNQSKINQLYAHLRTA